MRFGEGPASARTLVSIAMLAAALVFGCSEEEGGAELGELIITLTADGSPDTGFTTSTLMANAELQHPPGATVVFGDWEWTVDGADAGIATQSVDPSNTARGEIWQVSGIATVDGVPGERVFSQELELVNSRPLLTLDFPSILPRLSEPAPLLCEDDDLAVDVVISDADGDPLTITYEWRVNTVAVSSDPVLDSSFTSTDPSANQVTATITADDGFTSTSALVQVHQVFFPGNCTFTSPPPATAPAIALADSQPSAGSEAEVASASRPTTVAIAPIALDRGRLSVSEAGVCQLDAEGAIDCDGAEGTGLEAAPEGAFGLVRVADDYACALRAEDGGIVCWGEPLEDLGQLDPPEGAFIDVDLARETACGLRASGEIACWGDPSEGRTEPPAGVFVHVDVSDTWACAMDASAAVICWGDVEQAE